MPSCPFLKIKDPYKITVGDVLDLERKAFEYAIVSHRAKSYCMCRDDDIAFFYISRKLNQRNLEKTWMPFWHTTKRNLPKLKNKQGKRILNDHKVPPLISVIICVLHLIFQCHTPIEVLLYHVFMYCI